MKHNIQETKKTFSDLENELKTDFPASINNPVKRKLEFFWDECTVEDKGLEDRIFTRVQETILGEKQKRKKKKITYGIFGAVAVAASLVLIFLGVGNTTPQENFSVLASQIAKADFYVEKTTLTLSETQILTLCEGETLKYTADGKVMCGSKEVTDKLVAGINTLDVPQGRQTKIELADGTIVSLNANSRLIFPSSFDSKQREVKVVGEAFFEVAKNAEQPFIVNLNDSKVRVLGTSFNVLAPKDASKQSVVLVEGKVLIQDNENLNIVMSPNERVELIEDCFTLKEDVDVRNYVSWKDGYWTLTGETLIEILSNLEVYYNCELQYNEELANIKLYGKLLIGENIDRVLRSIDLITPLNINTNNNEIYISRR